MFILFKVFMFDVYRFKTYDSYLNNNQNYTLTVND